jgi:hypothetical protein
MLRIAFQISNLRSQKRDLQRQTKIPQSPAESNADHFLPGNRPGLVLAARNGGIDVFAIDFPSKLV